MRRVGDEMKTCLPVGTVFKKVALIVLLIMSTVFLSGCVRNVTLRYSISIIPKEGETLENVTVYLPFPAYKNRSIQKIFNEIETDYKKYRKDEFPGAKFNLVSADYGKMLKVEIPKLHKGFPIYGRYALINTAFDRLYPQDKYVLSTMEQKVNNGEEKSYVHIYSDFEDGTGFILRSIYDVDYSDWSLAQAGGGGITLIGIDKVPEDYSLQPYSIEINQKGWLKLPVVW